MRVSPNLRVLKHPSLVRRKVFDPKQLTLMKGASRYLDSTLNPIQSPLSEFFGYRKPICLVDNPLKSFEKEKQLRPLYENPRTKSSLDRTQLNFRKTTKKTSPFVPQKNKSPSWEDLEVLAFNIPPNAPKQAKNPVKKASPSPPNAMISLDIEQIHFKKTPVLNNLPKFKAMSRVRCCSGEISKKGVGNSTVKLAEEIEDIRNSQHIDNLDQFEKLESMMNESKIQIPEQSLRFNSIRESLQYN